MNTSETIEKVIREGHLLADAIKKATSIVDIDSLYDRVEAYCDFIDKHFGEPSDLDDEEKSTSLSMSLYVAFNWKKKSLYPENADFPPARHLAEQFNADFLAELDSKSWA